MSRATAKQNLFSEPIPSIEIGSFVALSPDNSEFIGSASGVFFANTVFKAFSRLQSTTAEDPSGDGGFNGTPVAPTPGSYRGPGAARSWIHTSDDLDKDAIEVAALGPTLSNGTHILSSSTGSSYGINVPSLGTAPPVHTAKELLVRYFQKWHPFFPFLHGPTFFDQVNIFYGSVASEASSISTRSRLCRAITFQCIFNIAASGPGSPTLDSASRIRNSTVLTNIIGLLSNHHDIASLQTLLAMELYMVVNMSLRAASTIHSTLTRLMQHAGFHRCPVRYVQIPSETCEIRKRIFWSVYVLDRTISQNLGHPLAMQDTDIDVCIPGQTELHRPVKPLAVPMDEETLAEEEVQAHLPRSSSQHAANDENLQLRNHLSSSNSTANLTTTSPPAPLYTNKTQTPRKLALGFLGSYSRLTGEVLDLFHGSIHARAVTREKLTDLTSQIHAWWNKLPLEFQEISINFSPAGETSYVAFFGMLYNHLIIMMNRPFLSLPIDRMEFHSSLQAAIGASHNIAQYLKHSCGDAFLMTWPGTLAATWMAGLTVAFACLLNMYPLVKAKLDMHHCLVLLEAMGTRWSSARQCRSALESLLNKLVSHSCDELLAPSTSTEHELAHTPSTRTSTQGISNGNGTKRRRFNDTAEPGNQDHFADINIPTSFDSSEFWNSMPVLQYQGPDFGFDTLGFFGPNQNNVNPVTNTGNVGFFNDAGWDAFVQGLDPGAYVNDSNR